jgi:hypothetical protein
LCGREGVEVQREAGRAQRDEAPRRARHRDRRGVGVVERLEHDDLVAGLEQPEHRGRDRLRRAERHLDAVLRVDLEAVAPALVRGDRRAQLRHPGKRRVLVGGAAAQRGLDGGHDLRRAVGVREALAEVDRARARCERRHLCEDRRAEGAQPCRGRHRRALWQDAARAAGANAGVVAGLSSMAKETRRRAPVSPPRRRGSRRSPGCGWSSAGRR